MPLSRPTPYRSMPIATTGLLFGVRLHTLLRGFSVGSEDGRCGPRSREVGGYLPCDSALLTTGSGLPPALPL